MRDLIFNGIIGAIFSLLLLGILEIGNTQTLTWLSPPGYGSSTANAVSGDGAVVAGRFGDGVTTYKHAFRWANGVMTDLGTFGGPGSDASGLSDNGEVLVGWAETTDSLPRAFRWQDGTMIDLGTLGGLESRAFAISGNGAVIVGAAEDSAGFFRAVSWENGINDLGTLGGDESWAFGVSADGTVISGGSLNIDQLNRAFRLEGQTMLDLGTFMGLPTGRGRVSADGTVVVGRAADENFNSIAYRWTAANGMGGIGTPMQSIANNSSADGSIVVGSVGLQAIRWTVEGGIEILDSVYNALLMDGSLLYSARDISGDGRYIVGHGYNSTNGRIEGFLLDTQTALAIGVRENNGMSDSFILQQNYPNPFNPVTHIGFQMPVSGLVQLQIYDISGRLVKTLLKEHRAVGDYIVDWDGMNEFGHPVAAGIYFYRMTSGNFLQIRKMLLVR